MSLRDLFRRRDDRKTFEPELFRTFMSRDGLNEYTDAILALAQNSIRIEGESADDDALETGVSKFYGTPDLPQGVKWPWSAPMDADTEQIREAYAARLRRLGINDTFGSTIRAPLSFLAQIRLSDIAQIDTENRLPHSGMLYFFYDAEHQPIPAEDPTSWRVIYFDGDLSTLSRTPPPDAVTEEGQFQARSVTFRSETTLPGWGLSALESLGMSREMQFRYSDILDRLSLSADEQATTHRLLGYPDCIQGDVFFEAVRDRFDIDYEDPSLPEEAAKWTLLFQMDSIVSEGPEQSGPTWGDGGKLYFLIPKTALAARDFSQVWLVEQCG